MPLVFALILGVIQGITEFFPVSSSAHLKLMQTAFGISNTTVPFDLACHLGTLLALLFFFKGEIKKILTSDRKKMLQLTIALVPLFPSYFFFHTLREHLSTPPFLGLFLIVTALLLFGAQKIRIKKRGNIWRDILLIGTMQSAALIPGLSRSASTISCAQMLGWEAKEAVRFSFLLAIPTIIGANLYETQKLWKMGGAFGLDCIIGFCAAFFVGMAVIRFAMHILEKGKWTPFAYYCFFLGSFASLYLLIKQ